MDNRITWAKWGLAAVLAGAGLYMLLPILFGIANALVLLAFIAAFSMVCIFLLPAFTEALAQLGFVAFDAAIGMDPIARLKRDVDAHQKQIDKLETNIAEAGAEIRNFEDLLKKTRALLSEEEVSDWLTNLSELKAAYQASLELRNEEMVRHEQFKLEVQKAEGQYKLGKAFKSAFGAFKFNKKDGPNSQGAQMALQKVQTELNRSKARLNVALSRPKAIMPAKVGLMPAGFPSTSTVDVIDVTPIERKS